MKRAAKPITFRAYADDKQVFWVEVRVFKTQRLMNADIRHVTGKVDWRTAGQVSAAEFRRRGKKTGVFAIMWLNQASMTKWPTEVLTHESVHAAIRYFERRGWSPCLASESDAHRLDVHERRHEERLAYAAGRIAKYVTRGMFRYRVWVNP